MKWLTSIRFLLDARVFLFLIWASSPSVQQGIFLTAILTLFPLKSSGFYPIHCNRKYGKAQITSSKWTSRQGTHLNSLIHVSWSKFLAKTDFGDKNYRNWLLTKLLNVIRCVKNFPLMKKLKSTWAKSRTKRYRDSLEKMATSMSLFWLRCRTLLTF